MIWSCHMINKVTEGSPFTSTETAAGSTPSKFSPSPASLMDSFPLTNKHLHLSFFFTCRLHQCDYSLRGTENTAQIGSLRRGYLCSCKINEKCGVRAALKQSAGTTFSLSQLYFHCLDSIFR